MKLRLWNILQNNIHPFLWLFCFLSSSVISGATEWGPHFLTFFFITFFRYHFCRVNSKEQRVSRAACTVTHTGPIIAALMSPIKCCFSLLNSIFVQRNRESQIVKKILHTLLTPKTISCAGQYWQHQATTCCPVGAEGKIWGHLKVLLGTNHNFKQSLMCLSLVIINFWLTMNF